MKKPKTTQDKLPYIEPIYLKAHNYRFYKITPGEEIRVDVNDNSVSIQIAITLFKNPEDSPTVYENDYERIPEDEFEAQLEFAKETLKDRGVTS